MKNVFYISKQQEIGRKVYDLSILDNITTNWVGADTENTGLDAYTLTPILLGIVSNNDYYIINLLTYSRQEIEAILNKFKDKLWIIHNAKYDIKVLKVYYNVLLENIFCTYVNHQIFYNGCDLVRHSYDAVVERLFNIKVDKAVRSSFINRNLSLPITDEEINYLVGDLEHLYPVYQRELAGITQNGLLECSKLENQFTPVLASIELNGINLDRTKWKSNTAKYEQKVLDVEYSINQEVLNLSKLFPDLLSTQIGKSKVKDNNQLSLFSNNETISTTKVMEKFNISSSAQILDILKKCGAEIEETGEESLNKYLLENPNTVLKTFIELLLEHREYNKLISSFGNKFLDFINPVTGFIHSDYFQNNTATGRLSCSKPNIQQIPGIKEIRECFIPDSKNYQFVNIDLSGQELSVVACYSKDPTLLASFNEGLDLHSHLAQSSFRLITKDKTLIVSKSENKDLRNAHKPIIFGAIYAAGAKRIGDVLNISFEIALEVYKNLKNTLPALFKYQDKVKKEALRTKSIRCGSYINRIKRFNYLSKLNTEDYKIEKEACNFPIQSTSASMLKLCSIALYNYFKDNKLDCKIKASIHDELIIQIPYGRQDIADKIKEIMQNTANIFLDGVKMNSDMSVADYWKH